MREGGSKTFCALWSVALADSPRIAIFCHHDDRNKEEMKTEQKIVAELQKLREKVTFDWLEMDVMEIDGDRGIVDCCVLCW